MLDNSVLQTSSLPLSQLKHRNMSLVNETIDVINKGCFGNYDCTACIRNGILSSVIFVTFILCIVRIVRLHWFHHNQNHQYLIFYLAAMETCILGVKWLIGSHLPQLEFSAIYLQLVQFILLCHFHWTLAVRILHREKLVSFVILPMLVAFAIYFTLVSVFGIIYIKSSWLECMEPHWLMLSVGEFVAIQLFLVAGFSITQKINTVSAIESFKRQQKRELWSVIAVFELAALTSVIHDAIIKLAGSEESGCSGIYHHVQAIYTPILTLYIIIRFLLPIWVMLWVYQPVKGHFVGDEERLLSWTIDSPGSTFTVPINHGFKPLCQPVSGSELGGSPPVLSAYTALARGSNIMTPGYVTGILRRTILTPIKEEETCGQLSSQESDCRFAGICGYNEPHKMNNV